MMFVSKYFMVENFSYFRHEYKLPYFDGVLAPNTKLQEAAKLLEGKIAGPESITADRNGE